MRPTLNGVGRLDGVRVLVVDDEFLIALDLEAVLQDAGAASVVICTSVEDGVEAIEHERFDIAVLDVRLGGQTSAPIARLLADKGVQFVFYSGQGLPAALHQRFPDAPVLAKPARHGAVVEMMRQQLGLA
jgi:CheY-like chemotaxis protein